MNNMKCPYCGHKLVEIHSGNYQCDYCRTMRVVNELRKYNKWRRGSESENMPDPTELGKLIDNASDLLEELIQEVCKSN